MRVKIFKIMQNHNLRHLLSAFQNFLFVPVFSFHKTMFIFTLLPHKSL